MKLSEVKRLLNTLETLRFELQNGTSVPEHFHITEVGEITKHFIDCGGKERLERKANFQLWNAADFDHRLAPQKLLSIIGLSEKVLGMGDLEIEVEYQSDTIGKYELDFNGNNFVLKPTHTTCLASDKCGIPAEKLNINLANLSSKASTCAPGGGCC